MLSFLKCWETGLIFQHIKHCTMGRSMRNVFSREIINNHQFLIGETHGVSLLEIKVWDKRSREVYSLEHIILGF